MPTRTSSIERWTCERSADLYGIREWGSGYYGVNTDSGEVEVTLHGEEGTCTISLMDVVAGLKARGLGLPVLLRFGDILDTRIAMVNTEFHNAIRDAGYRGEYRGVYPIKVNQQQQVIEEITRFGKRYHHGLEAGSKAELIAALAYLDDPEAFLVCNGYKDEEFVDLALYGQKMGVRTVLVLEMPGELPLILRRAAALGVRPRIGVRMKPTTRASGHWNDSGGDRSVFGLNAAQLIDVVDQLRQAEMLDCLQLLHYHLGSQLPNIRDIRRGVGEACRVYTGLVQEGAPTAGRRRRPGRRLRRLAHQLRQQPQLHHQRVLLGYRRGGHEHLRRAGHTAPDTHQRVRPGARGVLLGAHLQHPRHQRIPHLRANRQ